MNKFLTVAFTSLVSLIPAAFAEVITDWTMEKIISYPEATTFSLNLPPGAMGVAWSSPAGGSYAELETSGPGRAFIVKDAERNLYLLTTADGVSFDIAYSSAPIPEPEPPFDLDDFLPGEGPGQVIVLPSHGGSSGPAALADSAVTTSATSSFPFTKIVIGPGEPTPDDLKPFLPDYGPALAIIGWSASMTAIPEPATVAMLVGAAGIATAAFLRRRR